MSGHHANIEKWRREQSVIRTAKNRPDLLEKGRAYEKRKKAGKGNTKDGQPVKKDINRKECKKQEKILVIFAPGMIECSVL